MEGFSCNGIGLRRGCPFGEEVSGMQSGRHRRTGVLRGTPQQTQQAAEQLVEGLPPEDVLWVRAGEVLGSLQRRLGRAFDVVVLDLHGGLQAEALGLCQGFVWGGGWLLLRMPPQGEVPEGPLSLVVSPHAPSEVGHRLWDHLERCLRRSALPELPPRLSPAPHTVVGTEQQQRAVQTLRETLCSPEPALAVLLSERGRGKSSALGLAARGQQDVVITAATPEMAQEALRHAGGELHYVAPGELARGEVRASVILVDEAAALPVPLLRRLVESQPGARFAMATTVRGYEGTGRGFVLRFLAWARGRDWRMVELGLQEPIRWSAGDPVERLVAEVLLEDAEPASAPSGEVTTRELDRDRLAQDEPQLRQLFGLLVHAHYRTTPSDLHRLLDAPNLSVHGALTERGEVVAATLLAREGELSHEQCASLARGTSRIRAHALPETLIVHSGHPEAGRLRMIRSVRIATHPELRRQGLARQLVEHVHAHFDADPPDLFGTLFGVTPELLHFRRSVGYELVRVGASRGARSGEPSAVMLRPVSPAAHALLQTLRAELARDLPLQLELMALDGEVEPEVELQGALLEGLPEPAPLPEPELRRIVSGYVHGPRPYDVVATALTAFVQAHASALVDLEPDSRRLIELRVLQRVRWTELARRCGLPTVPAAMRALRRATAALVTRVEPDLRDVLSLGEA
jgi:tRNA(Met) cytidine acetyltransferase